MFNFNPAPPAPEENNTGSTSAGVVGAFQDSSHNFVDGSESNLSSSFMSGNDLSDDDNQDIDDQDGLDFDDNDAGDDIDMAVVDSLNTSSFTVDKDVSVGSDNTNTVSKTVDVDVEDSGNSSVNIAKALNFTEENTTNWSDDDVNTTNSGNTLGVNVDNVGNHTLTDSFNASSYTDISNDYCLEDNDLVDLDGLQGRIDDILSVGGDGNVLSGLQDQLLTDNDLVMSPSVSNSGWASVSQDAGCIDGGWTDSDATVGNVGGDSDVGANATASADAAANLSAFGQTIETGLNTQYARIDTSVVGGSDDGDIAGDDA
ncbi:hypothetical protein [Afifella aestuarii]|uniref:hypothetical protein n=1 Tax=Afifella aestuarii TaxID=1909496 RepID=UPI000FE3458A|nr:hypothetical protein [Afifella aestuarii]